MKQIFMGLAATVLLFSCATDDVTEKKVTDNKIAFSPFVGKSTKALDIAGGTALQASTFNILVSNSEGSGATMGTGFQNYVESVVSYTALQGWTSNPVLYWQEDNSYLDFLAVANNATYTITDNAGAAPTVAFTNALADAGQHQDLLVAYTPYKNSGALSLDFKHVLSKIAFSAKTDSPDLRIEVIQITLNGVINSGTYNTAGTSVSTLGTWSTVGTGTTGYNAVLKASPGNQVSSNTAFSDITDTNGAILIIPQTTDGMLNVKYKVYQNNELVADYSTTGKDVQLTTDWLPGKYYRYNLTLKTGVSPIQFQVTVDPWANASDENIIVPPTA
ncbi:MAG: fimbrillin family protein [Marinifilaceae bacterium]